MNQRNYCILFLLITVTLSLGNCFTILAQGFSYVYIQGDKKTPIYTKVEGVMMPRYGKNYALLSRLAPGPLNVEILFQQNEFPPVQFNILVPENGKRAFVLQRKDDAFALYDVEQNFYLKANNDVSDDHIPSILNNASLAAEKVLETKTEPIKETSPEISKDTIKEEIKPEIVIPTKTEETLIVNTAIDSVPVTSTNIKDTSKPKFIDNIVFDNEVNKTPEASVNNTISIVDSSKPNIPNSDCKSQISALNFLKLNNSIVAKKTENEKLGLIIESTKRNCFSTEQGQKMVSNLETDIAKFTAIKNLYPKTTDQSNFSSLSNLLVDEEWKNFFAELIQPK